MNYFKQGIFFKTLKRPGKAWGAKIGWVPGGDLGGTQLKICTKIGSTIGSPLVGWVGFGLGWAGLGLGCTPLIVAQALERKTRIATSEVVL